MIPFLKYRKIYFVFSGILILGSLVSLIIFGLKPGIDFTGGSILELEFKDARPSNQEIRERLANLPLGEVILQPAGEKGLLLRMKDISEDVHQELLSRLNEKWGLEQKQFELIGSTIGQELKQKTKIVIILAILSMFSYIAIAFSGVPRPIRSWQAGAITIFILFHDVLIPLAVFSLLGKFYGIQITIPVTVALLTVVGYAINNVVVVFDRVRENLFKVSRRGFVETFEEALNSAVNQTLSRQINTSLTTLFPLIFMFFLGGETIKYFALALILGIVTGFYSSIFLATPILISLLKWRKP
ncbi:MAG: protein translocase subunit SecF [Candidatus Nealsonbacteria bacterium CG08_land_8_20_14_0_20_38_20]|uniref:Protein-export membrane protein SecF n=1 Tax=Candidatus Nealsonbacteria bacterium CG08_land_8_20_14_0_20_38_20 TaxID=1974705 RepID=A0A2H0YNV4_9BACT|nr:MAG: protein translocase subunit SecF [Candidatus Nealsonbacteria bacterium CG08_land_8_20_14_0_20_38_20]